MRTLSDNFAAFGGLRGLKGLSSNAQAPAGHLATLSDFGSNPGRLAARFHVPAALPDQAPLVVVLHGCTQNAAGYDHHAGWSQLAEEAGFALLFPEQHAGNNPNLCFNWFRPGDTRRDAGEALSIRQMIEAMILAHGIDRERIFITGLSAGGAMASAMLATYPELFAGGAIIAGLAYGRASTVPEAFDCMRGQRLASDEELWALLRAASPHEGPWPRISIWQGAADPTVAPSNAENIAAQWRSVHGLDAAPTQSEILGPRARRRWCDAKGDILIEVNTLAHMGHGTPIGEDLGVAGPYMLDVGVSSTREIASFWGLRAGQVTAPQNAPARPATSLQHPATRPAPQAARGPATPDGRARPATSGVRKTIEDALRAAGLMR